MCNSKNSNDSWHARLGEILANSVSWFIALSAVVSFAFFILNKITDIPLFKQISFIALIPFSFLLFFVIAAFFGSFIIYCFLCLISGRNTHPTFFIFGEDGCLPRWGAFFWLVVIFIFFNQLIPVAYVNYRVQLGLADNAISLYSSIDQTTLRGMFTAWVMGDRTFTNTFVSWSIIAGVIFSFAGFKWVTKKLLRILKLRL